MSRIILAFFLILVELLPAGQNKSALENNVRDKIDQNQRAEQQITPKRDFQTVEQVKDFKDIAVQARAAYFIDLHSGQVLVEKDSEERLPMASITKLMTALIVIEKTDLNEIVTVPSNETRFGDSTMGLVRSDRLTVYNLLQGLLINSGSDAVLTMAMYTAGTEANFVSLMNERATMLGLSNTQFTNPVGWDEVGHYSTAHDLAILTTVALKNPTIKEIVAKKSALVVSATGRRYLLTNTNLLLSNKFLGAKTGTTYAAGECLASYYVDRDKELVGVVLDSSARFRETSSLIDLVSQRFIFKENR
jgi:D-alanyl-D-alanine carboxypeptidase